MTTRSEAKKIPRLLSPRPQLVYQSFASRSRYSLATHTGPIGLRTSRVSSRRVMIVTSPTTPPTSRERGYPRSRNKGKTIESIQRSLAASTVPSRAHGILPLGDITARSFLMCPPYDSSNAIFPPTTYPIHPQLSQIVQGASHTHNANVVLGYAPFLNLIHCQGGHQSKIMCFLGLYNTTPEVPPVDLSTQGWAQCDPLVYPPSDYNPLHRQGDIVENKELGLTSDSGVYNQFAYGPVRPAWSPLEGQNIPTEKVIPPPWQVGDTTTLPLYQSNWERGSSSISAEVSVLHLPGFDRDQFNERGSGLAVDVEAQPQLNRHSHQASSNSLWDYSEMCPNTGMDMDTAQEQRCSSHPRPSIPPMAPEVPENPLPENPSPRPICLPELQTFPRLQHEDEVTSLGTKSSSPLLSTTTGGATTTSGKKPPSTKPKHTLPKDSKKKRKIPACLLCKKDKKGCGGPQADHPKQACRPLTSFISKYLLFMLVKAAGKFLEDARPGAKLTLQSMTSRFGLGFVTGWHRLRLIRRSVNHGREGVCQIIDCVSNFVTKLVVSRPLLRGLMHYQGLLVNRSSDGQGGGLYNVELLGEGTADVSKNVPLCWREEKLA
ncbi:hypothetical protein BDN72DRAFT_862138 [Pluteus cervinus]|uniref:Uncharacterized protein n=1 Tax=Pluteus cervinus TaxID=181527 RepID=A0ACD3ACP7_9AGAR|nr:hypothetical protein BDN72DRAFT_862138 [Pluteus cervinus]